LMALAAVIAVVAEFTPLPAMCRSTSGFVPCVVDGRVRFEPGAEKPAEVLAEALSNSIQAVEAQQYGGFRKPVLVYVCAKESTFEKYGGPRGAAGFVLHERLFIGPKPENRADRLPQLLTHELSHLQFEQQLGMVKSAWNIPGWFREGIAVEESAGGGAERVSVEEAKAAIAAGRTFDPLDHGRILFDKSAQSYGMTGHMWYRQSSLLVQFLRDRDEGEFRRLMRLIEEGVPFESAIERSYGEGLDALVKEFRASIAK
jgi:hypothetical protein